MNDTRHSASLKPSHHGSRTSSREPVVRSVDPSVAVFSVQWDSRFGRSHPMVVERYKALDGYLFRTDEHGAISVRTDGQFVWVAPYIGEAALVSTLVTYRITETLARPRPNLASTPLYGLQQAIKHLT